MSKATLTRLMVSSLLLDLPNVTMQSLKAGSGFDTNGYIQAVALTLGPM